MPARVRISVGRSALRLYDDDDLADHPFELPIENIADLNIGVAGDITGRHHRVVVRIHRGGAADHPLGELLR